MKEIFLLTKPRVTFLVIFTTAAGIFFAPGEKEASLIFWTLFGTTLLVGAANSLNMYLERETDALMGRTQNRPLPSRRLSPQVAFWFGMLTSLFGILILFFQVNHLTALLGLIAAVSYLLLYTPLKQKNHVALLIGAVPGALPPLMGWTAITNQIRGPGLFLFLLLFLWQVPHFLAIALLYQDEYQKAGIRTLPIEKGVEETRAWMIRYLLGLLAVSLYPVLLGRGGMIYLVMALGLGFCFFFVTIRGSQDHLHKWARTVFLISIVYLPLVLITLLAGI